MKITIDIGNSTVKYRLFSASEIVDARHSSSLDMAVVKELISDRGSVRSVIVASTRERDREYLDFLDALRSLIEVVLELSHALRIPIKNGYKTPETLGMDRLAGVVGAMVLRPGQNVMVVDIGTALTVDVVTAEGEFVGGNISPGAEMRFRALHEFTGRLPKLSQPRVEAELILGKTTEEAIQSGVIKGIEYEIEGYIMQFSRIYSDLCTIFTGGSAIFFAKRLKNTIFVECDLVAYGLNRILEENDAD